MPQPKKWYAQWQLGTRRSKFESRADGDPNFLNFFQRGRGFGSLPGVSGDLPPVQEGGRAHVSVLQSGKSL